MAELNEIYGNNYEKESLEEKIKYSVKLIGTNIAHKNFVFKHDSTPMWDGNNISERVIKMLLSQVQKVNSKFRMTHVDKRTDMVNMFPYLINGSVEYFVVTSMEDDNVRLYSLYITPNLMEAY